MGALESKLSVSYTLHEKIAGNIFLDVYNASQKTTSERATVFVHKSETLTEVDRYNLIQHAVKKLKTIRHPGIIKFVQAQVEPSGIFIVTEPVKPLSSVIKGMQADEVCLGIYSLLVRHFKLLKFQVEDIYLSI